MDMYDTFYDLKTRPFCLMPDPEFFYFSKSCRIALSLLELGLTNRVALNILLGDEGIGKTSIIQHFADKLPNEYKVGIVTAVSGQSTEEFLSEVLEGFGVMELGRAQSDVLGRWNDLVAGNMNDGRNRILIIDDAEHLSFDTINIVLGFLKQDSNGLDGMQIILSGHSKLTESFKYSHMESWISAAGLSYRLQPLSRQETAEYIRYRLATAGSERQDIFDGSGLDAVFDYSEGVPQRINFLCDSILDYGHAEEQGIINRFWVDKTVEKWNESKFKDPTEPAGKVIIYDDSETTPSIGDVSTSHDDLIGADVFDSLLDSPEQLGESPVLPASAVSKAPETSVVPMPGEIASSPAGRSGTPSKAIIAFFLLLGTSVGLYWANFRGGDSSISPSSVARVEEETTPIESESVGELVADDNEIALSEKADDDLLTNDDTTEFSALVPEEKETGENRASSEDKGESMDDAEEVQELDAENSENSQQEDSAKAQRTEKEIQALVDRGDHQLSQLMLTYPKGKNAYETYSEILEIKPDDKRALGGLQQVADKYLAMAEYYLAQNRYKRSYTLIRKGLEITPQDKELNDLEGKVAGVLKNVKK